MKPKRSDFMASSKNILGEQMKRLRKNLGLTQNQLGVKVKINGRQLARYEIGQGKPSLDVLLKLADFFEVSLDFLVTGNQKEISKKARINDQDLLRLLQLVDRLDKAERDKIKWFVQSVLSNSSTEEDSQT
jgi:transcriptional regulator with XRE-family HTH domain